MKKTLPTQFVIERVDSPIWGLFINELNEMLTNKSVSNKIIGNIAKYYGVFIDVPVLFDEIPEGFELISLSTYADIKQIKYELVTTYDGVETADFLCVTIHDDAPNYAGEFALASECRHASLNEGFALRDDVITAYSGETFIRETDEDLDLVHSEYNDGWIDREYSVYGYYDRRDEGCIFLRMMLCALMTIGMQVGVLQKIVASDGTVVTMNGIMKTITQQVFRNAMQGITTNQDVTILRTHCSR
jgi:hypothetical protein